jgi:predicted O-linked N-acetylglucosamine transferase (SPINDLY family)
MLHARPSPLVAHTNARDPDRVLRVGYISSDFGANQGAFFIEALLRSHRRDRVTVKCYSTLTIADDVTRRMQSTADAWADVATLSAEELATLIRRDGIDVLVDLSGHSRGNRLAAFAQRPAPVQMTYLGYPGAVGASGVTYCVTDVHLDPPGTTRPAHPERLIRLPETYFCYDPKPSAPSVAPTPALAGQPFALGSFNKLQKLNEPTIRIWSGVLRAVPRSRLRLKTNGLTDKGVREMIWSRFASYGIQRQRIEMLGYTPFEQHLPLHNDLDIALDPLIFNGGTTSLHALWMGVPVVTLAGTTPRSRMGVSLLSNLGLTELIAKTEQEYIAKCAALAGDLNRLNTIRLGLRERMQRSPLTDSKRFTAHLEEGYRAAWRDWCAGRAPGDITI